MLAPVPVEPEPSRWELPDPALAEEDRELIGIGADLESGTLLNAYRMGLFPMPIPSSEEMLPEQSPIGWWSPNPRGVLPLDQLHVSKSLRRSMRNFEICVDTAFSEVVMGCADPTRPHGWITNDFINAYTKLFKLGWAHSVETWDIETGELAGGLYGISIGGLFAAESKFFRKPNASKVAVAGLVSILKERDYRLLDVQWKTDHLYTLGVVEIPRVDYLNQLQAAISISCEPLGSLKNI